MIVKLDGRKISSEEDFHTQLSHSLDFGEYYGRNLHALYDRLSTDVERPVTIIWECSDASRESLGDSFFAIVDVLARVRNQDQEWGLADRFDFELR